MARHLPASRRMQTRRHCDCKASALASPCKRWKMLHDCRAYDSAISNVLCFRKSSASSLNPAATCSVQTSGHEGAQAVESRLLYSAGRSAYFDVFLAQGIFSDGQAPVVDGLGLCDVLTVIQKRSEITQGCCDLRGCTDDIMTDGGPGDAVYRHACMFSGTCRWVSP